MREVTPDALRGLDLDLEALSLMLMEDEDQAPRSTCHLPSLFRSAESVEMVGLFIPIVSKPATPT